eukprot:365159-Chlamydomonas_euryale.AAC.33
MRTMKKERIEARLRARRCGLRPRAEVKRIIGTQRKMVLSSVCVWGGGKHTKKKKDCNTWCAFASAISRMDRACPGSSTAAKGATTLGRGV